MNIDYVALREKPRHSLALTGLHVAELDNMLTDFAPAWERHHRWHKLEGKRRQFAAHSERPNALLAAATRSCFSAHLPKEQQLAATLGG